MKKIIFTIALGIIASITLIAMLCDWFANRVLADFWPLDASRVGPNLVASVVQWAVVVVVASFIYPPLRHWIEIEIDKIHKKLDRNAKLSHHIIKHHPDIPSVPDFDEGRKNG